MLWFICFFNYADRMAINAVSTVLKKEFHFDNEQFGMIASAFMYVYALSSPFAGQIGDRFPRKFLILGGPVRLECRSRERRHFADRSISSCLSARQKGWARLFISPRRCRLVADYHTKKTRSLAMGLHQTSVYAGTIGGTTLAGLTGREVTAGNPPSWCSAFAASCWASYLRFSLREPARNEAERLELASGEKEAPPPPAIPIRKFSGRTVLVTPTALLLILAFFGANSVGLVFMTWMPNYLSENFGMALAKAAFVSTFYQQIASVVGATSGRRPRRSCSASHARRADSDAGDRAPRWASRSFTWRGGQHSHRS